MISCYPMIAMNKECTDMIPFRIQDGPCPISDEYFVLSNRPGTPVLRYDTIMRGMDIPGLYEGDIISYKHKDYCIKYQRGFNAISLDGQVLEIKDIKYINVKTHAFFQNTFKKPEPVNIKFKVKDKFLPINRIFGAIKKGIVVNDRSLGVVDISDLQQDAGIRFNGKRMYFGKNNNVKVRLEKGRIKLNVE